MFGNRLFNLLIAIALVLVIALTAREAFATTILTAHTNSLECSSLPSRYSIHIEPLKATGTRLAFTEDGPTGIDGGLINLMSSYRTCSR